MKACLECLPCLGKNAVDCANRSTPDPVLRQKIVRESLALLAQNDLQMPPPYTARQIMDIALKYTGAEHIYDEEKRRSNELAEQLVGELSSIREYDPASFESRLRLAAAGNILDFGIFCDLDIGKALNVVRSVFAKKIDLDAVRKLKERMDSAENILYILDNCGEAVFDRVFLEPYREKITLGVRGRTAFNDVLAGDLPGCGLQGFTKGVISSGTSGIPGTILELCSNDFREQFRQADLIIAKGQGNFETLSDTDRPIAFLFLAKCAVVARLLQSELNAVQIRLRNF